MFSKMSSAPQPSPSFTQKETKQTTDGANSITKRQRESLYALGFELYKVGQFQKAADLFKLLCLYEPNNARNWTALGGANQQGKEHEAALAAFLMASFHDPLNPELRLYAAHSLIDLRDLPAALDAAQTALRLCEKRDDQEEVKLRAALLSQALRNYITK